MPYTHHPHHRQSTWAHLKSQWTISKAKELAIYTNSVSSGWIADRFYWGLHLQDDALHQLGVSQRPRCFTLKIAKFVGDCQDNWHGYPVAHWLSPWDKPADYVLRQWKDAGFINKAKMSRIHRGRNTTCKSIYWRRLLGFPDLFREFDPVRSRRGVESS